MSSDMENELETMVHASMPLSYTKNPTLLVDVVECSDGRWSARKEELFDESGLKEPVEYLKVNLNEPQKQGHPDLLLM
jgi:hypothetical protein